MHDWHASKSTSLFQENTENTCVNSKCTKEQWGYCDRLEKINSRYNFSTISGKNIPLKLRNHLIFSTSLPIQKANQRTYTWPRQWNVSWRQVWAQNQIITMICWLEQSGGGRCSIWCRYVVCICVHLWVYGRCFIRTGLLFITWECESISYNNRAI